MSSTTYLPLFYLALFSGTVAGGLLLLSHFLGPKRRSKGAKQAAYECGISSISEPRERFSVKFYLVAMLFIIFDIEVVFLYPWAVLFKEFLRNGMGLFLFVEMAIFLGILLVGLLYIYGRRALEWE